MKSFRFLDRRAGYSIASLGLLLGMVLPNLVPAFASAESQVQDRSVQLSTSQKGATADYDFTFTTSTAGATYAVVWFCSDTPIVGQTCAAPGSFSASAAAAGTNTVDPVTGSSVTADTVTVKAAKANAVEIHDASLTTASHTAHIQLTGLVNPSAVTTASTGFYARIQTYATDTTTGDADDAYASATAVGNVIDDGGVAMAITDAIGVSAAVRETMTFCVSGQSGVSGVGTSAPSANCGTAADSGNAGNVPSPVTSPSLVLGEGTPKALTTTDVSTGVDYAQLSTNASSGAVVNLKTSTSCGGLVRTAAPTTCDIAPATSGITAGQALFGLKLGSLTQAAGAVNPTATNLITPASAYSDYSMDYSSSNPTTEGVTSPYGSTLFSSTGPVSNTNVPMTFAASSSNTTPAGMYGATLVLIATGKY